jgi:hypothetical protein
MIIFYSKIDLLRNQRRSALRLGAAILANVFSLSSVPELNILVVLKVLPVNILFNLESFEEVYSVRNSFVVFLNAEQKALGHCLITFIGQQTLPVCTADKEALAVAGGLYDVH